MTNNTGPLTSDLGNIQLAYLNNSGRDKIRIPANEVSVTCKGMRRSLAKGNLDLPSKSPPLLMEGADAWPGRATAAKTMQSTR